MSESVMPERNIYVVIEFRNNGDFTVSAHKFLNDAKGAMAAKAIIAQEQKICEGKFDCKIDVISEDTIVVKWDKGSKYYSYQIAEAPYFTFNDENEELVLKTMGTIPTA